MCLFVTRPCLAACSSPDAKQHQMHSHCPPISSTWCLSALGGEEKAEEPEGAEYFYFIFFKDQRAATLVYATKMMLENT